MAQPQNRDRLRASIAYEAARIINDLGQHDYNASRNKAAQRLGCKDKKSLPSNEEIEQALVEYQKLFHAKDQQRTLNDLRHLALDAMVNLKQFSPRLVGSILSGSASANSRLQLHLFSESPEQIALHLLNSGIPYQEIETTLSFNRGQKQRQPAFTFHSGETKVELIWFPAGTIGHPPLSAIDQKPAKRASITQLRSLINSEVSGGRSGSR